MTDSWHAAALRQGNQTRMAERGGSREGYKMYQLVHRFTSRSRLGREQHDGARRFGLMLLGGLALLLAGCGSVNANLHFIFRPDGTTGVEATFEGDGPVGDMVINGSTRSSLEKRGWKVALDRAGGRSTLHATLEMLDPASVIRKPGAQEGLFETFDYQREPGLLSSTYRVRMQMPPLIDKTEASFDDLKGNPLLNDEQARRLVNGMVSFTISATVPGEIEDTNADRREGSTATWFFDYEGLSQPHTLSVTSRAGLLGARTQQALVILGVLGLALLLALAGLLRSRLRRTPPAAAPGQEDRQY